MFGLMKAHACLQTPEQKNLRRLHYCGTCKTIGRLYGQSARFLLNHDTVFLGELLSAISPEDQANRQWQPAYQSYNCFSLPKQSDEMPLALQFAAAATIVLTEFKIADHISDSSYAWARLARRVFSKDFHFATTQLKQWGFPVAELRDCLNSQDERETNIATASRIDSIDEALEYLAAPTAIATGLFFQYGAILLGQPEAAKPMSQLGHAFGRLIYLLDALEDFEKDLRKRNFNAFRAVYAISDKELPARYRKLIVERLWAIQEEIATVFNHLPISRAQAEYFITQLQANLSAQVKRKLPLLEHSCSPLLKPPSTFKARWRNIVADRSITDVSCNLMLLGAVFNSAVMSLRPASNNINNNINNIFSSSDSPPTSGNKAAEPPPPHQGPVNHQGPAKPSKPATTNSTASTCETCGCCCECATCLECFT